jgi:hypothetical protein
LIEIANLGEGLRLRHCQPHLFYPTGFGKPCGEFPAACKC